MSQPKKHVNFVTLTFVADGWQQDWTEPQTWGDKASYYTLVYSRHFNIYALLAHCLLPAPSNNMVDSL